MLAHAALSAATHVGFIAVLIQVIRYAVFAFLARLMIRRGGTYGLNMGRALSLLPARPASGQLAEAAEEQTHDGHEVPIRKVA